jgi:pyruvate dehydrogenase E1 component
MPQMPEGVEEGVLRGLYRYEPAPEGPSRRATILFSGPAWKAASDARDLLAAEHDVAAELWSATSYKLLREDALSAERWARLHPGEPAPVPYVTASLSDAGGPVIAVSDFMKSVPEMVARWMPGPFVPLGTDGYGRSDTRAALRRHFEVDAGHVVVATLHGLAQAGEAKAEEVTEAIERYEIDAEAPDPRTS